MKKIKFIIIAFSFVFSLFAQERTVIEKRITVIGEGPSKKLALLDALQQAIMQERGINIVSDETTSTAFASLSKVENGEEADSSALSETQNKEIHSLTEGYIRSYEILDSSKLEGELTWRVKISALFLNYKTPGYDPHNRRKLAILPFRSHQTSYLVNGNKVSREEVSRKLIQNLTSDFTQARRFSVLDREYVAEVASEKKLIASGQVPVEEIAKLGQTLGADYVIVGSIEDLAFGTRKETIGDTGFSRVYPVGLFNVHYRILVVATGQIKWADTVDITADELDLDKAGNNGISQFNYMVETISDVIARQLMSNIYPIKIVNIASPTQVVLNQGGKTIVIDEEFGVYQLGEVLVDDYTGESLGRKELYIGKIKVTRVLPKVTYAKIIDGELPVDKKVDYICRRIEKKQDQKKPKSGVKLPF
jgi:curli biogenesis system outer membrane secretion channel CsgG